MTTDAADSFKNMDDGEVAHVVDGLTQSRNKFSAPAYNLAAAQNLAAAGFHVFPVQSSDDKEKDKSPVSVGSWTAESTCNPATLKRWFQNTTAMPAIDCGKSRIVVIDLDRHGGPDGVEHFMKIMGIHDLTELGCPVIETAGGGYHLIYTQPAEGEPIGCRKGALAGLGIDTKGSGGYVVAAGSVRHDGRSYRPMPGTPDLFDAMRNGTIPPLPAKIAEMIRASKAWPEDNIQSDAGVSPASHGATVGARERAWARAALSGKKTELAQTPKGERNIVANAIAYKIGRIVGAGWLPLGEAKSALADACQANGLAKEDPRGCARTLASGLNKGMANPRGPLADHDFGADGDPIFIDDEQQRQSGSANRDQACEAPRPLFRPLPPAAKYPVDALGDILAPAARAIMDRVQCPDALAAQSVLAAASLAVQAHADVEIPATGHTKPVSLDMLAIASSGDRKSGADIEASWALRKHEQALKETFNTDMKEFLKARKAWDAAEKKALNAQKDDYGAIKGKLDALGEAPAAPILPMKTCPEPTYEGLCKTLELGQPSMGIFSDEGGAFISGHGMSPDNRLRTMAGLSSLWDGTTIKRVRVGDGANIIAGKRLTVYLMVQPDAAGQLLSDPVARDQGFLSRFLISAPDSIAGSRFQREPVPESAEALKRYSARILSILERPAPLVHDTQNELEPRVLPFNRHAVQAWRDFADHVERLLAPGKPFEPIRGFANKLPEHAARIAAVLTLVDDLHASFISCETFERAIVLAEYYAREALRLFDTGSASPELRRAEALRKWLMTWDEPLISMRAIVRLGPNSIRDTTTANAAIEVLVKHGWLTPITGGATVEGKPVRQAWKIVKEEEQ